MAGPRLIRAFADAYPEAVFVEIGANDGETWDFLRPYVLDRAWRGVLVEPVPYVFDRLKANYPARDGLVFENVAIGCEDGRRAFFHPREEPDLEGKGLPDWYDGIGSFSREEVLSHAGHIPDIESRLVATEVPVLTLDTLCRRHGIDRLDLLLIDAEGHDWEIIRHLDLASVRPRLLVYEHYHLSRGDRAACREHLHRAGYETMEEHFDTFCLDPRGEDALAHLWRRLEPAVPGIASYEDRP
jgi:FkbM family methyltransferase